MSGAFRARGHEELYRAEVKVPSRRPVSALTEQAGAAIWKSMYNAAHGFCVACLPFAAICFSVSDSAFAIRLARIEGAPRTSNRQAEGESCGIRRACLRAAGEDGLRRSRRRPPLQK